MTATSATDCIIAATYFCIAIMWVHFKYVVDGIKVVAIAQPWWDRL